MSSLPKGVCEGFETLQESTSCALAAQIQVEPILTPLQLAPIETAFVKQGTGGPPLLLLPGFDSSLLEFRRLFPYLTTQRQTWSIDLLGFGFTARPDKLTFSPANLKLHLYACWQQWIDQPVVLVGASMGGTAAIDFALTYPDAVHQLVLLDSAGIKNGPVLGKYLFSPLDDWAVKFLSRPGVRRNISRTAYHNPDRCVTADAELCAALHLQVPGWHQALKSFTRSGGYPSFRDRLAKIQHPTLIVWGCNDRILGTADAATFSQAIPESQLVWIEQAGHVPHLEQPDVVAEHILQFVATA